MILSLYLVSQNTCAAQFASNTADVDIATQVGCYADGDAGVESNNFDDDLCDDFKGHEFIEPCGRSMGATRKCGIMPTDFDDDLIVL